ncbi:MAG: NnrS family protein, partial [Burkholderiales bacterium]
SMLIAMVSRVSLGHSGRRLEADTLTWVCYFGVIAAALVRAAAEFAPAQAMGSFMIAAAVLWLTAFGAWAWRYVPMYLAPRV